MKVVSWNIHRCFGTDRRYRPDRIVEVLRSFDADVISLQEIDSSLHGDSTTNQLDYIARGLGLNAVMGPTLHRDYGAYGNAILSRFEFLSCEEGDLSFRKNEPRGALAVEIVTDSGPVRVVNTHLGLKYWERSFQIDRLLDDFIWRGPSRAPTENEPGPQLDERVIVTGDFNEWFRMGGNNARLERAFDERSPRIATYPATWPRLALDRIFLSGPIRLAGTDVPRNELTRSASDHLPLIASIEFARGS